jgi:sulfatase modifying factor 1
MKYIGSILLFSTVILTACVRQENKNIPPVSQPAPASTSAVDPPPVPATKASESIPISSGKCPSDMVEVEGDYCPNQELKCLYNVDNDGKRLEGPGDLGKACGEFQNPAKCLGERIHMHYCIDRYEWPNKEGQVPQDWMTYFDAQNAVASVGKRLCTHREWTLAAEGPNMHPLPYGDGFHRERLCNFDNKNPGIDVFQSKNPNDEASRKLRALLVPSGSMKDCVSDFGVHDMSGNIDEWVVNESSQDMCINKTSGNCRTGLMGGHIWHVRNASRPMTTAHGAGFSWYETGTRACKDIP